MSADLSIKTGKIIELDDFKREVEKALCNITQLTPNIQLDINTMENGKIIEYENNTLGNEKDYAVVQIHGLGDGVVVNFTKIDLHLPYVTEDQAGIWAGISVGLQKSSLEIVLAAAIAEVIAKANNSKIIDEACLWSTIYEHPAETFLDSILENSSFSGHIQNAKKCLCKVVDP